ncbi:hypothetical protein HAP47_0022085 [Bradyrhizobium sp. 41S5]|uniref:hypothetical protein n=1 Tax=Bradyrhizobium sp. 41S5 TaxID=1404443 RepID=UPI00156ABFBF|nr:hypothetical protein [Bradyrhizobium sp. 41S5]UFX41987.1 hypothetical protein HAP47_0022085 [Bradyrhizobium sp. 41S5]
MGGFQVQANEQEDKVRRGAVMKAWRTIALHTAVAAGFMFLLQRYGLSATLESSLLWAIVFGGCAAGLAYSQANR